MMTEGKRAAKGRAIAIGAAALLLIAGALALMHAKRARLSIDIPRDNIDYIIVNCGGMGPRKLDYAEHSGMIDSLAEMLSGEYKLAGRWSSGGRAGGGPNAIFFYVGGSREPLRILYVSGRVAVERSRAGQYYLYRKPDTELKFSELEEYVDKYGVFSRS